MQTAGKPTGPDVMNAAPSNARLLNLLLPSILALIVVRLWLMPLPSSFWIDEMATVFVVHNGAKDASLQVAPPVAQSIYYVLPGMLARLFGNSEVAYAFLRFWRWRRRSSSSFVSRSALSIRRPAGSQCSRAFHCAESTTRPRTPGLTRWEHASRRGVYCC